MEEQRQQSGAPVEHRIHCRICMCHCGAIVTTEGDHVVKVAGDPDHPLSRGYLCPKGRMLGALHHHENRLNYPMMRRDGERDGEMVRVEWDELLDDLATKLRAILDESGRDAIGDFTGTAFGMDAASRWVHPTLAGAFGPANRYGPMTIDCAAKNLVTELMAGRTWLVPVVDQEQVSLLVFVGSNPVVSHGQFAQFGDPVIRLREIAQHAEVWVVDPRRTETARLAHRHIAPRPGTDYAILAYLVREVLRDGADADYVRDHTSGVDELAAAVAPYDLDRVALISGVDAATIDDLLAAIRRHGRVVIETGTGVTMAPAGNVTEWLKWALEAITGTPERPGRWYGPGWLSPKPDGPQKRVDGEPWSAPPSRPELPARWGQYPCAAMADEIEAGHLRAMFVFGGNPLAAIPDSLRLGAAMRKLDVLAVCDVVPGVTTELATHLLPSPDQLERADVSNTGFWFPMLVGQYSPRVAEPADERRPPWWVCAQLAKRLGIPELCPGLDPDTITEDAVLAAGMQGARVSFDELRATDGPVVIGGPEYGWVVEHLLEDHRWKLAPAPLVEQLRTLEPPPGKLVLQTGREPRVMNSFLHDTDPRGRAVGRILLNSSDAADAGVADGGCVRVTSANGSLEGLARITDDIRPGAVRVPHSFREPDVARLTSTLHNVDPLTGMSLFIGVPVTIEPVEAPATAG